jgi:hypothetical protein
VSNRNNQVLEFTRKNTSLESKKNSLMKNGSLDLLKSTTKQNRLRDSLISFNKRDTNRQILNLIPKAKKNIQSTYNLRMLITDFSLKAMKITNNGSILYLALHKQTGSIYAVKSIRKAAAKARM